MRSVPSVRLLAVAAVLLGRPIPPLAVQILWLNLVTDGLAALAHGLEKPEQGVMRRRPWLPSEPLIGCANAGRIVGSRGRWRRRRAFAERRLNGSWWTSAGGPSATPAMDRKDQGEEGLVLLR